MEAEAEAEAAKVALKSNASASQETTRKAKAQVDIAGHSISGKRIKTDFLSLLHFCFIAIFFLFRFIAFSPSMLFFFSPWRLPFPLSNSFFYIFFFFLPLYRFLFLSFLSPFIFYLSHFLSLAFIGIYCLFAVICLPFYPSIRREKS